MIDAELPESVAATAATMPKSAALLAVKLLDLHLRIAVVQLGSFVARAVELLKLVDMTTAVGDAPILAIRRPVALLHAGEKFKLDSVVLLPVVVAHARDSGRRACERHDV